MARAKSIRVSNSREGSHWRGTRLLSLCERLHVYLSEKKSSIFANKDLIMSKASVLFLQVVNRAVNQHQRIGAVPTVTVPGKSPVGTDPGEEDH